MARDIPSGSRPSIEMELVPCKHCGRTFVPNRIEYHENVCIKSATRKKREPYDSVAHRWKGTDNEPAIKWLKNRTHRPPTPLITLDPKQMPFPTPGGGTQVSRELQQDGIVKCPSCNKIITKKDAERHINLCKVMSAGRERQKEGRSE